MSVVSFKVLKRRLRREWGSIRTELIEAEDNIKKLLRSLRNCLQKFQRVSQLSPEGRIVIAIDTSALTAFISKEPVGGTCPIYKELIAG